MAKWLKMTKEDSLGEQFQNSYWGYAVSKFKGIVYILL